MNTPPIYIHRCFTSLTTNDRPELVVCWDGSLLAHTAPAYLRFRVTEELPGPWQTRQDMKTGWKSHLFASRGKLAPLAGITPPRGNSECTISAAESKSATLKPYLTNRVAEVDEFTVMWEKQYPDLAIDPPFHVPGMENKSADMATRDFVSAYGY